MGISECLSVLGLLAAAPQATAAQAAPQTASPTPAPVPASTAVADVVVTAPQPAVVEKIDRTVHDVRSDAQAQAVGVLDILGKLPSVTVSPNGGVRLLGQAGVKILVDGKPPLNTDATLKSLTGADIDRIEVMTNPSARYGAEGGAGIINIISRRSQRAGLSGTAVAQADSYGGYRVNVAPTWTWPKGSIGGSLGVSHSESENRSDSVRRVLEGGAPVSTTRDHTERDTGDYGVSAKLKAAYKPDDRQTLSLSLSNFYGRTRTQERSDYTSPDVDGAAYQEVASNPGRFNSFEASLDYERTGPREGQTLSAELDVQRFGWRSDSHAGVFFDDPARIDGEVFIREDFVSDQYSAKTDLVRPMDGKRLLSLGASFERQDQRNDRASSILSGEVDPRRDYAHRMRGRNDLAAAYATFQFPLGSWTLLPGLRYEASRQTVRAALAHASIQEAGFRPSLHVSRDLPAKLKLKLSYARRVDRPDPQNLDPTIFYGGNNTGWAGNPDLRPARIDTYEARLSHAGDHSQDLTVYSRETRDAWSTFTRLTADGVSLSYRVNAGEAVLRGAELSTRGPIGPKWRYTASANLFHRQRDTLRSGVLVGSGSFGRSGSVQLDYRPRTHKSDDQWQVAFRYSGPEPELQGSSAGWTRTDLTWRRQITPTVTSVLTVIDLFDQGGWRSRLRTETLWEDLEGRGGGTAIRLALTRKLGVKPTPAAP